MMFSPVKLEVSSSKQVEKSFRDSMSLIKPKAPRQKRQITSWMKHCNVFHDRVKAFVSKYERATSRAVPFLTNLYSNARETADFVKDMRDSNWYEGASFIRFRRRNPPVMSFDRTLDRFTNTLDHDWTMRHPSEEIDELLEGSYSSDSEKTPHSEPKDQANSTLNDDIWEAGLWEEGEYELARIASENSYDVTTNQFRDRSSSDSSFSSNTTVASAKSNNSVIVLNPSFSSNTTGSSLKSDNSVIILDPSEEIPMTYSPYVRELDEVNIVTLSDTEN